jgi:signal transduction histidine kinase
MEELLSADGFCASGAPDGSAALVEAARARPDLVLCDLHMPTMGGLEVCKRLHEVDPDLPVIVMTAFGDMESAIECLRAGADDYLIKPLDYDTVLSRVERAIRRRNERLCQTRQELQRDEYLALVSHDLRTPLSSVALGVAMLQRSLQTKALLPELKLAERIERNVVQLRTMIEDLSEATTLESQGAAPERHPCDLRALVVGVVDRLDEAHASRIAIEAEHEASCLVVADGQRLERVVGNLLTNALKYSDDDAPVTVMVVGRGSSVELHVVDRGIGIAPESVDGIFSRYYRAPAGQARASGLGLGLYIARLIVEAHGGRIDVSSEVGKGSDFRVVLPSDARPVAT